MNNNVIIVKHPLCEHNLSIIRDKNTTAEAFRNAIKRITEFLFYKASEDLETEEITVETPLAVCKARKLSSDREIMIVPVLRAGLIFSDVANEIIPSATVRHIGMYRDEDTLEPVWYYNKIPVQIDNSEKKTVFILDPMLATGNSAIEAIKLFVNKKVPQKNIKFISLISAPEGLENVSSKYPDVKIITAAIDEKLNDKGYIMPGLGDAGDRLFNTTGL